jgi:hypothetical protein
MRANGVVPLCLRWCRFSTPSEAQLQPAAASSSTFIVASARLNSGGDGISKQWPPYCELQAVYRGAAVVSACQPRASSSKRSTPAALSRSAPCRNKLQIVSVRSRMNRSSSPPATTCRISLTAVVVSVQGREGRGTRVHGTHGSAPGLRMVQTNAQCEQRIYSQYSVRPDTAVSDAPHVSHRGIVSRSTRRSGPSYRSVIQCPAARAGNGEGRWSCQSDGDQDVHFDRVTSMVLSEPRDA